MTTTARTVAALIAASAWIGLIVQFDATLAAQGTIVLALASLLWFFTILTNLLVAIVFTGIALGRTSFSSPSLIASTTLYILLVGITYGLLLHGLPEPPGHSNVANALLHMVTPAIVPIFWLLFAPKGHLHARHPLVWAIYPLGYLFYALIRGEFTHRYPYPFLNINQLGWTRTLINSLVIAILFLAASWLFVWIDSLLARRTAPDSSLIPDSN